MKFGGYILAILFTLCAPIARAEVLVFAAASLKEPIDEIAAQFDNVVVSYGGSGTLARQVSLGAPADVVLLANVVWMEALIEGGDVQPQTVQDFASNRLVVIGASDADVVPLTADGFKTALGSGRLAVGLTNAVPAGIYAKSALQSLVLWDAVSDQLAEVDNVRAALALVIRGQTPLGIVYQTDLRSSDAVREVAVFPVDSHPPIRYLAALTTRPRDDAAAFMDYLVGEEGQSILKTSGFLPPTGLTQ